jgi:hypothetical protein
LKNRFGGFFLLKKIIEKLSTQIIRNNSADSLLISLRSHHELLKTP